MKITGTIEKIDLNGGVWVLQAEDGNTYELYKMPEQLKLPGETVTVDVRIREDIDTMNMVGPVAEVKSFSTLEP